MSYYIQSHLFIINRLFLGQFKIYRKIEQVVQSPHIVSTLSSTINVLY
jgi:hypothetical protein